MDLNQFGLAFVCINCRLCNFGWIWFRRCILSLFGRDEKRTPYSFKLSVLCGRKRSLATHWRGRISQHFRLSMQQCQRLLSCAKLLLAALIFRAVSFEFHNKVDSPTCGVHGIGHSDSEVFFSSSLCVAMEYSSRCTDWCGWQLSRYFLWSAYPYSIGIGLLSLVLFTMHGAIYLATKSDGDLRDRNQKWHRIYGWFMWCFMLSWRCGLGLHLISFDDSLENPCSIFLSLYY